MPSQRLGAKEGGSAGDSLLSLINGMSGPESTARESLSQTGCLIDAVP